MLITMFVSHEYCIVIQVQILFYTHNYHVHQTNQQKYNLVIQLYNRIVFLLYIFGVKKKRNGNMIPL